MKRNMDLIRRILFEVESLPANQGGKQIEIEGWDFAEVTYHAVLLHEAGLIHGKIEYHKNQERCFVDRLTWEGHEFLEAARNDAFWKKAILNIRNKAGGLGYEVLRQVLVQMAKDAVAGE